MDVRGAWSDKKEVWLWQKGRGFGKWGVVCQKRGVSFWKWAWFDRKGRGFGKWGVVWQKGAWLWEAGRGLEVGRGLRLPFPPPQSRT